MHCSFSRNVGKESSHTREECKIKGEATCSPSTVTDKEVWSLRLVAIYPWLPFFFLFFSFSCAMSHLITAYHKSAVSVMTRLVLGSEYVPVAQQINLSCDLCRTIYMKNIFYVKKTIYCWQWASCSSRKGFLNRVEGWQVLFGILWPLLDGRFSSC